MRTPLPRARRSWLKNQADTTALHDVLHTEVQTNEGLRAGWGYVSVTPKGELERFVRKHKKMLALETLANRGFTNRTQAARAADAARAQLIEYGRLENVLLAVETGITEMTLDAQPRGYSTTFDDFLNDLTP